MFGEDFFMLYFLVHRIPDDVQETAFGQGCFYDWKVFFVEKCTTH